MAHPDGRDAIQPIPQVFVSKASEDGLHAQRAVVLLERAGLRAWLSETDIPTGAYHAAAVGKAIRESAAMLVLLSPHAVTSGWVTSEVDAAITHSIPVFPVALPGYVGLEGFSDHTRDAWDILLKRAQIRMDGDLEAVVMAIRESLLATAPQSVPGFHAMAPQPRAHPSPVPDTPVGPALRVATRNARGFVGRERHEVLESLAIAWDEVRASNSARVVVLLAETGFGKTRIVQELYRRLAAAQRFPPFWPADIVDMSKGGPRALKESRKRVTPIELGPANGAVADYLWLGHVVDEGYGGRIDAGLHHLAEDLGQALSVAALVDPAGRAARMAAQAMGDLGDSPAPGSDTRTAVRELLHRGAAVDGQSVAPGTTEAFWQGVRRLWSDPGSAVPTIIVVEDGHFAGQETISAFEQVATSMGLPFLVVICAQESQLGGGAARSGEAPAAARRPLGRLVDQKLPSLSVLRLTRLTDSDVQALLLEAIPDLDADIVREAVRKIDGNPYHAHTLLVEMVRHAEQGRLDVGWVQRRPASFEGELREQWRLLPDDVRRLLSGIAVLGTQVPERIGLHAMRAVYGSDPRADVDASLDSGWLRRLTADEALRFLERPRWLIANAESHEEWLPAQRRRIIDEALGTLESLTEDSGVPTEPILQELHLALATSADREGIPFHRVAAVRAGLASSLRLRLSNDDAGSLAVAQETDSLVNGHESDPGMAVLAVEAAWMIVEGLDTTLPEDRQASGLVGPAELVVARAMRVSHRRPDLVALAYSALSRAHRVRLEPARLSLSKSALQSAETWLARATTPDVRTAAEVLRARGMLTKALGDNHLSAEVSERRLGILERAFGPLDRRVLGALMTTAFYWSRVDIERSLALRRDLLERRIRVWGDRSSPSVAIAEKELAVSLARHPEQMWLAEAHDLAEHSLESLARARGAYDRAAVRARGVMCFTACRLSDELELAGEAVEAHALRERALAASTETLAHTGPTARPQARLIRRHRQAECMARLGDEQGVWILRELLEQSHVSSQADPAAGQDIEVLWTVAELVAGLFRLGREDEALALAAEYPIEREQRWPASQPRGWRSTRPEDARAGVL